MEKEPLVQWLRLQTTLLSNERFIDVSPQAKGVYVCLLMLAAREDWKDGRLIGALGPLGVKGVARKLFTDDEQLIIATFKELLAVGLLEKDGKVVVISRFAEKCSIVAPSTERVRAFRKRSETVSETGQETGGNDQKLSTGQDDTGRNGTLRDVTPNSDELAPRRKKRTAKPLPDIPSSLLIDYERLVAIDAAERGDGMIADSVVEKDKATLMLAFEKRGEDALRHGISVALGKGLGVRYAAGVVRRYNDARDTLQPISRNGSSNSQRPRPIIHTPANPK